MSPGFSEKHRITPKMHVYTMYFSHLSRDSYSKDSVRKMSDVHRDA